MKLNIATLYMKNGNYEIYLEQIKETRECLDKQQKSWSYRFISWNNNIVDEIMGINEHI